MKAVGWLSTGSHSMFAETIHSLVDTAQQVAHANSAYEYFYSYFHVN